MLGGVGSLNDIYKVYKKIDQQSALTPKSSIRARIYENCTTLDAFNGEDLLRSIYGRGEGIFSLKDFFDEILENLNNTKENYKKSNDEKNYLTEIKGITGNAVNDSELLEYAKLEKVEFSKKIKELYSSKKKSRIEILGENQNNSLEKKIFLQKK